MDVMVQLADVCKKKMDKQKEDEDDRLTVFCERLCSCSTLLLIGAVAMWITGFYFYAEKGTEGFNFLLSVGALSIAGLLTLCAISCFCDVAGKANKLIKNKKNKKQMERALSVRKVNCP